tara:strand:+ start:485 stop:622 length:138 start_codon:yes stop_codon:yes gene_type:complete
MNFNIVKTIGKIVRSKVQDLTEAQAGVFSIAALIVFIFLAAAAFS